jgi:hypothetical protein
MTAVLAAALDGNLLEAEQAMFPALRRREQIAPEH